MDLSSITNKYTLSFGNKTDVGRVREGNEDYMASFQTNIGHIFIVCDGMGGHTSGEIASRLAVTRLKDFIENNSGSSRSTKQLLIEALEDANQAIIDKTVETPEYKGMGTTCVILAIKSGVVYYANVGDSRMYIIRNGLIHQLTKDQTFVQTLVDQGHITYDDAENHPRKNELIQALGINEKIVPEVNDVALRIYKGDKFILCSDGLSGMIKDNTINDIVNNNDPVSASEMLVRAANENGGTDNITVQVISIVDGDDLPDEIKNVAPAGVLVKNTYGTNNISSNGNTTRQISNYQSHQFPVKKKSKTGILLVSIFSLLIITSIYFLFFNKSEKDKTFVSKSDSLIDNIENKNVNGKSLSRRDSLLENFLKSVYKGSKTEEIKLEDFDKIKFGNDSNNSIRYVSNRNLTYTYTLTDLIKNIKDNDLKYISISGDNFIVRDKSNNQIEYRIGSMKDKEIVINEIIFIRIIEPEKATDKNKSEHAIKNTNKTEQRNNNQYIEEQKTIYENEQTESNVKEETQKKSNVGNSNTQKTDEVQK